MFLQLFFHKFFNQLERALHICLTFVSVKNLWTNQKNSQIEICKTIKKALTVKKPKRPFITIRSFSEQSAHICNSNVGLKSIFNSLVHFPQ